MSLLMAIIPLVGAYQIGVREAYTFLVPGYFPNFGGPFGTRRDEQAYRFAENLHNVDAPIAPPPFRPNQIDAPFDRGHIPPSPNLDDDDLVWD